MGKKGKSKKKSGPDASTMVLDGPKSVEIDSVVHDPSQEPTTKMVEMLKDDEARSAHDLSPNDSSHMPNDHTVDTVEEVSQLLSEYPINHPEHADLAAQALSTAVKESDHASPEVSAIVVPEVEVESEEALDALAESVPPINHHPVSTEAETVRLEDDSQSTQLKSPIVENGSGQHTESLADQLVSLQSALLMVESERDQLHSSYLISEETNQRLVEEKTQIETQYRSLFGKVTQMKTSLGARLKQDAEELALNRTMIEDLEAQNSALNETVAHMQENVVTYADRLATLQKSKDDTDKQIASLTEQLSNLESTLVEERSSRTVAEEQNMLRSAEWENLAVEERSSRDLLRDRVHDLEEQLVSQNDAYQNLRSIIDQDNQTIARLKHELVERQEAQQVELQANTENLQQTIDELNQDLKAAKSRVDILLTHNASIEHDLEKFKPYEQEVKEKNLLIGKLRHEAVILNEHLTKALRLLKRGSSNDSVDRQLLNNLLLSFFSIPRQDSKRFEVLKILSSVLAWDDAQKEQAGLIRPGSGTMNLAPLSPSAFRSPPMSPSMTRGNLSRRASGAVLQAADFIGPNRESMSDLWINFLESEAAMNAADAADTT